MVTLVSALMLPLAAQAASKVTLAKQAYKASLLSYPAHSADAGFALIYVDNDNVPELAISDTSIYGYGSLSRFVRGTSTTPYYQGTGWTTKVGETCRLDYYYPKKNMLVGTYVHASRFEVAEWHYYLKAKGNRCTEKLSYVITGSGKKKVKFYYNEKGKKISKSKFNKQLKKLVGNQKPKKIKYYRITKKNIAKYCK